MGTYKYIYLDGYARISEHISAHNGTYLAGSGAYLARTMARFWHGIGYVDCCPVPIRFHCWFTLCSIKLHYRFASDSTHYQPHYRFALGYRDCIRYRHLHAGSYKSFTLATRRRQQLLLRRPLRPNSAAGELAESRAMSLWNPRLFLMTPCSTTVGVDITSCCQLVDVVELTGHCQKAARKHTSQLK